jgi:uncharacterized protein (TIGR02246 family)
MRRQLAYVAGIGLCAAIAVGIIYAQNKTPGPTPDKESRPDDRADIRKTMNSFIETFQKGDAAAAAALMTTEAQLIPDDAPALHGRDAIQKAFVEHFAKRDKDKVKIKIALDVESLHFTSRDTAIEEGRIKVARGKLPPEEQKYSVLYVREDGKWLLSVIKEWPSDDESLRDLEWLIGSWTAKRGDVELQSAYEWFGNKSFIKAQFSVKGKDKSFTAMQLIGIDPDSGDLRTWTFEVDGGVGQGTVDRDGKVWVFESSTTLVDGRELTSNSILLPIDNDTFTWQPVNIAIDGESLPDMSPVKVTRVKGGN